MEDRHADAVKAGDIPEAGDATGPGFKESFRE
jgi:hypothetical protein